MVHRLAHATDVVLGMAGSGVPFATPRFVPVTPGVWPPWRADSRYTAGLVAALTPLHPALIEVHNRARVCMGLAAAFPQTPMLLFVHNDPQKLRGATTPADRAAILRRATVVCVSHWLAARFTEGVPPGLPAPLVLPNTIDFAELPPPLAPDCRENLFLFAGRPVHDKGADAFVAAAAIVLPQLPGWRAEIIGAPRANPGAPDTPFLAALRPRALAAGVSLLGYRPHTDVLAAMARAAIVTVPSRWPEPFGLTALEAMASGAALIAGSKGGLPEVAGDAAVYVDPDEPGALANAMLALARDHARRASLAAAGMVRARDFDATQARAALGAWRAEKVRSSFSVEKEAKRLL